MKRFLLSPDASRDLDEVLVFLAHQTSKQADMEALKLQQGLLAIAQYPLLGAPQSDLTLSLKQDVRSRVAGAYRILYFSSGRIPEIIAILHTSRDSNAVLEARFH